MKKYVLFLLCFLIITVSGSDLINVSIEFTKDNSDNSIYEFHAAWGDNIREKLLFENNFFSFSDKLQPGIPYVFTVYRDGKIWIEEKFLPEKDFSYKENLSEKTIKIILKDMIFETSFRVIDKINETIINLTENNSDMEYVASVNHEGVDIEISNDKYIFYLKFSDELEKKHTEFNISLKDFYLKNSVDGEIKLIMPSFNYPNTLDIVDKYSGEKVIENMILSEGENIITLPYPSYYEFIIKEEGRLIYSFDIHRNNYTLKKAEVSGVDYMDDINNLYYSLDGMNKKNPVLFSYIPGPFYYTERPFIEFIRNDETVCKKYFDKVFNSSPVVKPGYAQILFKIKWQREKVFLKKNFDFFGNIVSQPEFVEMFKKDGIYHLGVFIKPQQSNNFKDYKVWFTDENGAESMSFDLRYFEEIDYIFEKDFDAMAVNMYDIEVVFNVKNLLMWDEFYITHSLNDYPQNFIYTSTDKLEKNDENKYVFKTRSAYGSRMIEIWAYSSEYEINKSLYTEFAFIDNNKDIEINYDFFEPSQKPVIVIYAVLILSGIFILVFFINRNSMKILNFLKKKSFLAEFNSIFNQKIILIKYYEKFYQFFCKISAFEIINIDKNHNADLISILEKRGMKNIFTQNLIVNIKNLDKNTVSEVKDFAEKENIRIFIFCHSFENGLKYVNIEDYKSEINFITLDFNDEKIHLEEINNEYVFRK